MKIILLTGLLIVSFSFKNVSGQTISIEKESGMVSYLIGEDLYETEGITNKGNTTKKRQKWKRVKNEYNL